MAELFLPVRRLTLRGLWNDVPVNSTAQVENGAQRCDHKIELSPNRCLFSNSPVRVAVGDGMINWLRASLHPFDRLFGVPGY